MLMKRPRAHDHIFSFRYEMNHVNWRVMLKKQLNLSKLQVVLGWIAFGDTYIQYARRTKRFIPFVV